jgi:hypothetical protein
MNMTTPSISKLSFNMLDDVGEQMREATPLFLKAYTYKEIYAYYAKSDSESVYCKGVRYAHHATKKSVILKICKLYTDDDDSVPNDRLTVSEFKTEAEYAKKAADIGIGPLVYTAEIMEPGAQESGPTFGVIAMYKFDDKESLQEVFRTFEREQRYFRDKQEMIVRCGECHISYSVDKDFAEAYQRALAIMWNVGNFMHMDLHQGNIFYQQGRFYFIDYGLVLPRAVIETASPETPFQWMPRMLDESTTITGLTSAYDTSAYDVISYVEQVLSRHLPQEVIDVFVTPRIDVWPPLMREKM